MNKYEVKMQVNFYGEIEAESQAEAENMAHSAWGESSDSVMCYDSVEMVRASDMGEICEECEQVQDDCECEQEDEADARHNAGYPEGEEESE